MSGDYSVVIPAYDAEQTLPAALQSVFVQTRRPAAVFVVNDGSRDATSRLAKALGATVIDKPNGGPGSATWTGLQRVETEFAATLDSDDLWLPCKMERQIDHLRANPDIAAVFSLAKVFPDGADPDPQLHQQVMRLWTRTTMVYRSAAALGIGEMRDFPERLGELVEWLGRGLAQGHRHDILDEVLAMRRKRTGSLSDKAGERSRGYLHAVRDAIARRKQAP